MAGNSICEFESFAQNIGHVSLIISLPFHISQSKYSFSFGWKHKSTCSLSKYIYRICSTKVSKLVKSHYESNYPTWPELNPWCL